MQEKTKGFDAGQNTKQRYVAKFVNGFHCAFDTEAYENIRVFYLQRDVNEAVKRMNNQQGGK